MSIKFDDDGELREVALARIESNELVEIARLRGLLAECIAPILCAMSKEVQFVQLLDRVLLEVTNNRVRCLSD